jgi:hypothetical protein
MFSILIGIVLHFVFNKFIKIESDLFHIFFMGVFIIAPVAIFKIPVFLKLRHDQDDKGNGVQDLEKI